MGKDMHGKRGQYTVGTLFRKGRKKKTASGRKAVCDKKIEEMEIEEFNRLLLGYSKSPPRSKL